MNAKQHRLLTSAAFAAFALLASAAEAQSPAATPDTQAGSTDTREAGSADVGGDIVVTAQKRAERLQDVPLAVTAVTGATLANRNITDTQNLTQVAPSLTFTQGNNPSNSTFRIRGIGTQVFGQGVESSVSVVVDGVVMARSAQGFADLADIERVEVLRGPQGTLFGKNATGGVINIVTERPSRDFSGQFRASVAEKGEYHANGTISAPLNEQIGVRVSGYYNKDDGYIRNVALNRKTNGYESWGMRGKIEGNFGPLNLLLSAEYSKNDATCCQQVPIRTDNPDLAKLLLPVVAGPHNKQVSSNVDTVSQTEQQIYSLTSEYDLGGAAITAITAYQKYHFNNNVDVDGVYTPYPIYTGLAGTAPAFAQVDINGGPISLNQISQEVRIASTGQNRLNYVVGGYYENLNLDRAFTRRIVTCPTTIPDNQGLAVGTRCPSPVAASGRQHAHLDSEQYAAFGQIDYLLVGGLKGIAGVRVQHQSIAVAGAQEAAAPFTGDKPLFTGATLTSGRAKASDTAVTGKASLQYEFSRDAQVYASYTRGYKGQGLGTEIGQAFDNNQVVRPETVNAFEIGFKGSTADRKLTIAIAAYLANYRDLQVVANRSDSSTGTFLNVTTNAGKAQTKGVELELTVRPDDHFSVGLGAAYIHARFDADGISCPLQSQLGAVTIADGAAQPVNACFRQMSATGVLSGRIQNVRNGILPNTPEWRVSVNPHYERDLSAALIGYVDLNLNFQSDIGFALEQDPLTIQDGYATVDMAIGVRPAGRGLSASVFVKNLTNQRYYTGMARQSLLTSLNVTPNNLTGFLPKGAFRYMGATIGYSF